LTSWDETPRAPPSLRAFFRLAWRRRDSERSSSPPGLDVTAVPACAFLNFGARAKANLYFDQVEIVDAEQTQEALDPSWPFIAIVGHGTRLFGPTATNPNSRMKRGPNSG